MPTLDRRLETSVAVLTSFGAVTVLFSIAASETFFALALLALLVSVLVSQRPVEFPSRLGYPLVAFVAWTLLSLAFSDAPLRGLSQVRKIFLYLILVLVYNAYQSRRQILRTFQGILLAGAVASIGGLVQFFRDYVTLERKGVTFYNNYVAHQITGFMSHWLTYAGELMMVLLLLFSLLLFASPARISRWWWLCLPAIALALLASFTRGVWLGTLAGLAYLLARYRRPVFCLLVPAAVLALYLVAPRTLQQRERSIFDVQTDSSNRARIVMLHTGLAMIAAHPVFGVGPERVGPHFMDYKPSSMELPPGWYGHLHNDYLQVAAERGIPCLIIFIWLFIEILHESFLLGRNPDPATRMMGHAEVAVTVGLMFAGLFEFNFGDSEVLMLYLFLIAAAVAWSRLPAEGTA